MNKTLLITRPKGDGETLSEALHTLDMHVVHEPLMEIFLRHGERHALEQALQAEPDAILLTSRYAVQALGTLTGLRDLALICGGESTAETAYSLGFSRVSIADGTAQGLIEYVEASYDAGSRFLYLSGTEVRLPIDELLMARGMETQRLALYEALPSEQLSDTVAEQLKRHQIDAVTLMSPRTAQIFLSLLEKAGLTQATAHLHAFVLSDAIGRELQPLGWRGIHVADEPTLASLVECIDNAFSE